MSYYTRNVLITANLSYKMRNMSEKDKINVINFFIFFNFFCAQ